MSQLLTNVASWKTPPQVCPSVATSGNLSNHGDATLSHSRMCREGLWGEKELVQTADIHTLGARWYFHYHRIMQVRIVGHNMPKYFYFFSINIVYNGTTPGAESPFHACQGCCDPFPPHSTSLLTFCRPDSVTIVNTCCKGIMTAVSPLSWQLWSQLSSGTLLPWLFNQPASLLKPSYGWLCSYLHSPSVILWSRLHRCMWQTKQQRRRPSLCAACWTLPCPIVRSCFKSRCSAKGYSKMLRLHGYWAADLLIEQCFVV